MLAAIHYWVAGLCSVSSIWLSFILVRNHITHYTNPAQQKPITRILLMVPIYSTQAYISLMFPGSSSVAASLREIYEGFVIYQFMNLLISYLGGEPSLAHYLETRPSFRHPWPVTNCADAVRPGAAFLRRCKQRILQYVLIRPLTAVLALIASMAGVLRDGEFVLNGAWFYLAFINNVSVSYSLYYLALFYMATKEALAPHKPMLKFMSVKAVVFMTYWQSLVLLLVAKAELISKETSDQLQDYMITIEMLIAALVHHWFAFPAGPYIHEMSKNLERPSALLRSRFMDVLNVGDTLTDSHSTFIRPDMNSRELQAGPEYEVASASEDSAEGELSPGGDETRSLLATEANGRRAPRAKKRGLKAPPGPSLQATPGSTKRLERSASKELALGDLGSSSPNIKGAKGVE